MATRAIDLPSRSAETATIGRLSGRMVGQLTTAEQVLVWALRQRLQDGSPASPVLSHGFRLAFGFGLVEPALAAFEALFQVLASDARDDICLCPLRCAFVSADEEAILGLVAQARCGLPVTVLRRAGRLAEPASCAALAQRAELLAALIDRAGLTGNLN